MARRSYLGPSACHLFPFSTKIDEGGLGKIFRQEDLPGFCCELSVPQREGHEDIRLTKNYLLSRYIMQSYIDLDKGSTQMR